MASENDVHGAGSLASVWKEKDKELSPNTGAFASSNSIGVVELGSHPGNRRGFEAPVRPSEKEKVDVVTVNSALDTQMKETSVVVEPCSHSGTDDSLPRERVPER